MGPPESVAQYPAIPHPVHMDHHAKGEALRKSAHNYDRQNLDVEWLVLSAAFR